MVLAGALLAGLAQAKVSHRGWPPRMRLWIAPNRGGHRDVHRSRRNWELLGSHGDDYIVGGRGRNVVWGDHIPGNLTHQRDVLIGGPGRDFIYTSHGRNTVLTGAGRDVVHAEYGRGKLTCGRPDDLVYVTGRSRRAYRFSNCTRFRLVRGR